MSPDDTLERTALNGLHVELGARLVPFAGHELPLHFTPGILAEHRHTRSAASLFDIGHMGLVRITGADPAGALERVTPADVRGIRPGRQRYALLVNEHGGIQDDIVILKGDDLLYVVVNAARKASDLAFLKRHLAGAALVEEVRDLTLLALQGPAALAALAPLCPAATELGFMEWTISSILGHRALVTRSGYTGEDGFELAVPVAIAPLVARKLLDQPGVLPAGLGARDSLRLEAGLSLYGHELDEQTTPVEAALEWTIGQRRRQEGGFLGADVVLRQLAQGAPRRRVGLRLHGPAPARDGTPIVDAHGAEIGRVTSGGIGPTAGAPIALGYVATAHATPGTRVGLVVRGRVLDAEVTTLPFVPHRYVRRPPLAAAR